MTTFLGHDKALVTTMVQVSEPYRCYDIIESARSQGTEAFGFQIETLKREYRTEEHFRDIFENRMGGYPIYVTSYRFRESKGMTDDECMDMLKFSLRCGATLGDVMGDLYAPCENQLTMEPVAVGKQMKLIDEIHEMGKEVLMSSHVMKFTPAESVLEMALAQQERGADISKIVAASNTLEEEAENLKIIAMLKRELKIPFIFLAGGANYRALRTVGGYFGNCMTLCVERYDELATMTQVPLTNAIKITENINYGKKD